MAHIAMISGHLDLTSEEFNEHYWNKLDEAVLWGHSFVIGDAPGADEQAQRLLATYEYKNVTIYYNAQYKGPRNNAGNWPTVAIGAKPHEKDKAMTDASDYDIAWVRPEKHSSVSGRVSGTEQNIIRRKAKG